MFHVATHPLLDLRAFTTQFPRPLGDMASVPVELLSTSADAPMTSSDEVRKKIRDLLRHGGFKPTGRSKPAAEYLLRAADAGKLGPINPAVDVCNAVSLHSGLPISVIDFDRATGPFRVAIADKGVSYVFNQSGQTIDVGGLLCLFDADGPCANAVKDAQRTKTSPGTTATLTVLWGTSELPGRTDEAMRWYRAMLADVGASIGTVFTF